MNYGTPYVETEAILAAQERDDDTLRDLFAGMLPGEKRRLVAACEYLAGEINLSLGAP